MPGHQNQGEVGPLCPKKITSNQENVKRSTIIVNMESEHFYFPACSPFCHSWSSWFGVLLLALLLCDFCQEAYFSNAQCQEDRKREGSMSNRSWESILYASLNKKIFSLDIGRNIPLNHNHRKVSIIVEDNLSFVPFCKFCLIFAYFLHVGHIVVSQQVWKATS